MGTTFERVKENYDLIELKERINLLMETAQEASIIATVVMKCKGWCLRRSRTRSIHPTMTNSDAQRPWTTGKFLLVAEKFEVKSSSEVSIQDLNDRIVSVNNQQKSEMISLKNEMKNEMSLMENRLKNELSLMKIDMKNKIKNEISLIKNEIVNDLRISIQEMTSGKSAK